MKHQNKLLLVGAFVAASLLTTCANPITHAHAPVITPPPKRAASVDANQLNSANDYMRTCGNTCTDIIQSEYIKSRLAIDSSDKFCDNYGDAPGSKPCFCANYLQDAVAGSSSILSCVKERCTDVPPDVQTFLNYPEGFVSSFAPQLNSFICPGVVNQALFTGPVKPPSASTSTTSSVEPSNTESTTSAPSRTTISGPSITASSSSTSSSTSSETSSSSPKPNSAETELSTLFLIPEMLGSLFLGLFTVLIGVVL